MTAGIELHPDNGHAPHVVVIRGDDGEILWFAYQDRASAERRLPHHANSWSQVRGEPVKLVPPLGY